MADGITTQLEWHDLDRERLTLAFGWTRADDRARTAVAFDRAKHVARYAFAGVAVGLVYGGAQICGSLAGMR